MTVYFGTHKKLSIIRNVCSTLIRVITPINVHFLGNQLLLKFTTCIVRHRFQRKLGPNYVDVRLVARRRQQQTTSLLNRWRIPIATQWNLCSWSIPPIVLDSHYLLIIHSCSITYGIGCFGFAMHLKNVLPPFNTNFINAWFPSKMVLLNVI